VATPAITGDTLVAILEDLRGPITDFLLHQTYSTYAEIAPYLSEISATASARAAADMALYDLEFPFASLNFRVATDVTLPLADVTAIPALVLSRIIAGFKVFKVKLANEPIADSLSKLQKVREIAGEGSLLRVDPNQSWSLHHTLKFLERVAKENILIEFLEQPTIAADKVALANIRRNSDIAVMADESCFSMSDLLELIDLQAVDLVNIKLLKSGSLYKSFEMAEVALAAGIRVLMGSMMEGDLGVANAARLAHAIAPEAVHDLDAAWWARVSSIDYVEGELVYR